MIQACALWRKRNRNGQTFYTGPMGGLQVFVFPNSKKEKDTQPDARIVFAQREFKKDAEPSREDMFDGDEFESRLPLHTEGRPRCGLPFALRRVWAHASAGRRIGLRTHQQPLTLQATPQRLEPR